MEMVSRTSNCVILSHDTVRTGDWYSPHTPDIETLPALVSATPFKAESARR